MNYLVTLGALALTLPAIGAAESTGDNRYDKDPQQMGQRTIQERLTRLGRDHITLEDLKGTAIVNRQDEEVGTISDVILDQEGRVAAVIVTTGGMMGVGATSRALSWDDVQVRAKAGDMNDEYDVVVNMSKQEVENLPEFETTRRAASAAR